MWYSEYEQWEFSACKTKFGSVPTFSNCGGFLSNVEILLSQTRNPMANFIYMLNNYEVLWRLGAYNVEFNSVLKYDYWYMCFHVTLNSFNDVIEILY